MSLDVSPYLTAVEEEMQHLLQAPTPIYASLYTMLRYHMGWAEADGRPSQAPRGKRLRPLLCLLACEAVGGNWQRAVPAAAAIELLHNFTLIHDDIEDDSPTRHHRPTVWKLWGLAQGINAGDALWALARLAAYRLLEQGHPPSLVLEIAQELDRTCLALCHGQYLDISFEGCWDVTEEAYLEMIAGKTAALVAAATRIGAMLGQADARTVQTMAEFGQHLGLAFQMTDDLLGIWGDPAITGKSAASDLCARKMTLPIIHALAWERAHGQSTLLTLLQTPVDSAATLNAMLACLDASGARDYVEKKARQYEQAMLANLQAIGVTNAAIQTLQDLALSIVGRER